MQVCTHWQFAVVGHCIFPPGPCTDSTELFDGISWVSGQDLPEQRFAHGLISYQRTKVFVFSGQDILGMDYLWATHEYDFNHPKIGWKRKGDIPVRCRTATYAHIR